MGTLGDSANIFYALAFNGEGVVMAQLAGRIVAELMAGEETMLTRLVLVNKQMPYLTPEPIRSVGFKLVRRLRRFLW